MTINPPAPNEDNEVIHDVYNWLLAHKESLEGCKAYDQMLEVYEVGRKGLEGLRCV